MSVRRRLAGLRLSGIALAVAFAAVSSAYALVV